MYKNDEKNKNEKIWGKCVLLKNLGYVDIKTDACEIKEEQRKCNSCVLSAFNLLAIPPNRFLSFARSLASHRQLIVSGRGFSLFADMYAPCITHAQKASLSFSGEFFPLIIFSTALIARVSCSRSRAAPKERWILFTRSPADTHKAFQYLCSSRPPHALCRRRSENGPPSSLLS